MSFNTRLPCGIHSTASTRPIWLSQLISHTSFLFVYKSHTALRRQAHIRLAEAYIMYGVTSKL